MSDAVSMATDAIEVDGDHLGSQKSTPAVAGDKRSPNPHGTDFVKFENIAQEKAFKRAMKAGKTRVEALELAKKAIPGPATMPRQPKKDKGKTSGLPLSYSSALKCIKLGVFAAGTEEDIPNEGLGKVADAILGEIRKNDDPKRKLVFQGISHQSGWLQVNCGNPETAAWLPTKAEALGAAAGLSLKVVDETNFPAPCLIRGFLPDCREDSNDVIREYLRAQSWLPTDKWQVVNRLKSGRVDELVFKVDAESLRLLEEAKFRVPFKFSSAQFVKVNRKRKDAKDPDQPAVVGKKARTRSPSTTKPKETGADRDIGQSEGRRERVAPPPSKVNPSPKATPGKSAPKPQQTQQKAKSNLGKAGTQKATPPKGSTPKETSPNVLQLRSRLNLGSKSGIAKEQKAPKPSASGSRSAGTQGPGKPEKGPRSNQNQKLITQSFNKQ